MKLGGIGLVSALAAGLLLATPVLAQVDGVPAAAEASKPAEPTLAMRAADRAGELARRSGGHADDVAALRAHYAANPDKPLWVDAGAFNARAQAAIAEIGRADDWGLEAAKFNLPSLAAGGDAAGLAEAEARLSLEVLKYARHARGGRMDPTQLTEAIDRTANLVPPGKVMAEIATAAAPDDYLRKLHPQHPQFERLRQLHLALRAGKYEAPAPVMEEVRVTTGKGRKRKTTTVTRPKQQVQVTAQKVLFNMEQWRWMPDDLGALHVAINIPEFQFRVMKEGREIHAERVVVGAVATQTPIFSKDMETVVFQPGWGVPPSIKVKQLLPGLLAGGDPVSARGYRMSYRGREVSAHSIDWRSVDIRRVSIVQPPGPSNALGMVKFLFPNKHDVYMHDTPVKHLFNTEMRAHSAGCVRVRNPMRFAEIIFAETAGWNAQRVASLARGKPENDVKVSGAMAVHITYFTVVVDDDGKIRTYGDLYGHEPRVIGGLEGRMSQVAKKPQDLNAIRSALVGRAGSRRVASYYGDDDRSGARGTSRQRGSAASGPRPRNAPAPRQSGGGGLFSWFNN